MYMQFFLLPMYLFFLNRHDGYVFSDYCRTRFHHTRHIFTARTQYILVEAAVFTLPLLFVSMVFSFIGEASPVRMLLFCISFFLGLLWIGLVCGIMNTKCKLPYVTYLLIFVLLSVDYFATMGYFMFDFPLFYTPVFGVFMSDHTWLDVVYNNSIVLISTLALFFIFCLLFSKKSPKTNMFLKKESLVFKKCFWAFGLGALLVLCGSIFRFETAEEFLACMLGGVTTNEIPSFWMVVLYNISILLQFVLFGSLVSGDMDQSALFLFSRSYSRRRWILKRMFLIVVCSLLFTVIAICTVTAGSVIFGVPVHHTAAWMQTAADLLVSMGLCNVVFLLAINIFSLKAKVTSCLLVAWILYMPGQILMNLLPNSGILISLYPSSQAVFGLHDIPRLSSLFDWYFQYAIAGFTPLFSLGYNLFMMITLGFVGLVFVKKHDFTI
jgi:hypothetical protein